MLKASYWTCVIISVAGLWFAIWEMDKKTALLITLAGIILYSAKRALDRARYLSRINDGAAVDKFFSILYKYKFLCKYEMSPSGYPVSDNTSETDAADLNSGFVKIYTFGPYLVIATLIIAYYSAVYVIYVVDKNTLFTVNTYTTIFTSWIVDYNSNMRQAIMVISSIDGFRGIFIENIYGVSMLLSLIGMAACLSMVRTHFVYFTKSKIIVDRGMTLPIASCVIINYLLFYIFVVAPWFSTSSSRLDALQFVVFIPLELVLMVPQTVFLLSGVLRYVRQGGRPGTAV